MTVRFSADQIAVALGRPCPTPEQREVVEAPLESMLVVAGAGSGKTETMAARVVWLVANDLVAPEEVLGLTFTRKAAGELAARISSRLRALHEAGLWAPGGAGGDADAPGSDAAWFVDEKATTVSTYHAYAGRMVEEHGLRLGVEPDARLLTEAAAWQLAHEVVTAYDGPMDAVTQAESTVTKAVVLLSGELAEHLRTVEEVEAFYAGFVDRVTALPLGSTRARGAPKPVRDLLEVVAARRQLLPLVTAYASAKRERDCLDFSDQVALAARLAREFAEVARQERSRYRVVLLDEFQDTSEAQMVLLRELFAVDRPGVGAPVPVMAVGDPHQSIYGWRGASATTLAHFPQQFADPDGAPTQVRHLSVSWRNDQRILSVANCAAEPLTAASPVPVRRLVAAPGAGPGEVEVARFVTDDEEAAYVAGRIAGYWFDADGAHSGVSAAVLCRRRAQFVPMVEALRARGVPVEVVGLGGLLSMPEVMDVVAVLSVVADPARGDRLMRLLTGPAFRLGAADLDGLAAWSRQLWRRERIRPLAGPESPEAGDGGADGGPAGQGSVGTSVPSGEPRGVPVGPEDRPGLAEALAVPPPPGWVGPEGETVGDVARLRVAQLAEIVARLRSMTGAGLAETVMEAARLLRVDVEVLSRPDRPVEGARVHLDAFTDAAASFQSATDRPTLGAFLAWLEVAVDEERGLDMPVAEVSDAAVQVLTVHAAKGLEWDVVAVPGLVEGAFPSTSASSPTWRGGDWCLPVVRDKGWCVGVERLPYELRGDADGLPELPWRGAEDLTGLKDAVEDFFVAGGVRVVEEERRLAYVAFTRARHLVVASASVWTQGVSPRVTSRFLMELVGGVEPSQGGTVVSGADGEPVRVGPWAGMPVPEPGEKVARPGGDQAEEVLWPVDLLAARRALVSSGVAVWRDQVAALPVHPQEAVAVVEAEVASSAADGFSSDAELLAVVRERRERLASVTAPSVVALPDHVSTSSLVSWFVDEEEFTARLRRPMPMPPAVQARAGTAFHTWVEEFFRHPAMVDIDEIWPGVDVDDEVVDIGAAKERFLASEWAGRIPSEIELAVETYIEGVAVRGRIDAVFPETGAGPDGPRPGAVVVDWKTGRRPTGHRARAAAVQLAVYRLAYARLRGLDLESVRGAFYYVSSGETVFPPLPGPAELAQIVRGGTLP
ncbi:DNA helicase-2 / ATP-dependent DNA helicase PcrA [Austwickia chelonae]|uniref:DNA 3'-5' helicase n=1 Tax=Austwickia chelonae NBRC 105200 TaxID=1184607 RepID=K6VSG3_9MICO|nr:ATP-dependent DNA helicase [Austwickia chelonae]GAB78285.1 putative ATP-dependent DNA helicase [Austwickia chelonae NBRC 105200]SEW00448.1 DNA helicase-2 / ATP-dependent DNA helicase PcrA [Austwickia chelonae]